MQQLLLDIRPPALPDLSRFVVGDNHELMMHLGAMLDGRATERMVYLWGGPDSGKTYLLEAWGNACRLRGLAVVTAAHDTAVPQEAQVTIVDNAERWDTARQLAVFAGFNRVRESVGLWLAAGRVPPADLPLIPELRTRLGWGLVFQMHPLNDAAKHAALAQHARGLGFQLDTAVAEYLLNHYPRDLGSLLRVLEALDRLSLETRRPITLPLVRQLMLP